MCRAERTRAPWLSGALLAAWGCVFHCVPSRCSGRGRRQWLTLCVRAFRSTSRGPPTHPDPEGYWVAVVAARQGMPAVVTPTATQWPLSEVRAGVHPLIQIHRRGLPPQGERPPRRRVAAAEAAEAAAARAGHRAAHLALPPPPPRRRLPALNRRLNGKGVRWQGDRCGAAGVAPWLMTRRGSSTNRRSHGTRQPRRQPRVAAAAAARRLSRLGPPPHDHPLDDRWAEHDDIYLDKDRRDIGR
eukprot:COSAG01_NODE_24_length_37608_cov_19.303154_3_plen_243_part_00